MTETIWRDKDNCLLLQSERLEVRIARPGTHYAGTRFDWTGFMTQVTLDGLHTFGIEESLTDGDGTGGEGFCNEFGLSSPVGYDEAQPNTPFPKLGVGLLTRVDHTPYSFMKAYPLQPYPMHIDIDCPSKATFTVEPVDCNGYAAQLVKTITVEGSRLAVDYRLTNTGGKPIRTNEYCHNFTAVDRQPIGPGYRLRLPDAFTSPLPEPLERGEDGSIRWTRMPETPFYCRTTGPFSAGLQWDLFHEERGAGLRESVDFAAVHIALWGTGHVISPEVFVGIDLNPGQMMTWSRQYEFYTV